MTVARPDLLFDQTGHKDLGRILHFRGELRSNETMRKEEEEEEGEGSFMFGEKPEGPRPIVTALWVSVDALDYEQDRTKGMVDAILSSFKVV